MLNETDKNPIMLDIFINKNKNKNNKARLSIKFSFVDALRSFFLPRENIIFQNSLLLFKTFNLIQSTSDLDSLSFVQWEPKEAKRTEYLTGNE